MSTFVFANNVQTALAAPITTVGQTTIVLASSANIPSIPVGDYWVLTLNDALTGNIYEIVWVTSVVGSTLTVLRGQEGTVANTWLVGDNAYATDTAATLNSFVVLSPNSQQTGSINISGSVTAQTALFPSAGGSPFGQGSVAIGGAGGGTSNAIQIGNAFASGYMTFFAGAGTVSGVNCSVLGVSNTVSGVTTLKTAVDGSGNFAAAGALFAGGAASTGGANTVSYGATVASTVGAAGGATALPATPLGYIIINVAGTAAKIPYYNN